MKYLRQRKRFFANFGWLLVVMSLSLGLSACGRKGPPQPINEADGTQVSSQTLFGVS